jgi:hypothetical protein
MDKQQFMRQRVRPQDLPSAVLAKWNAATLEEGFVPLPKKLLRCMPQIFLGGDAVERLALVMAIADYRRPNLTRGPSRDFLAFLSGLSCARVTELLEDLRNGGLIAYSLKGPDELDIDLKGLLARIADFTQEDSSEAPF